MTRFVEAAHRIHRAIGELMSRPAPFLPAEPKHLAIGLDLLRAEIEGLVDVLIAKQLITMDDYRRFIAVAAEREATRLERDLTGRS